MRTSIWLAVLLVACAALPAFALDTGLYLVDGTNDYYYISGGTRHLVQDFDSLKPRFFADVPVVKTRTEILNDIPTGEVITSTTAPNIVKTVKTTTTTTSSSTRLSRGLYMVDGSSDYVYVDADGRRHVVSDYPGLKAKFFADMPVQTTRTEVINDLPLGPAITSETASTIIVK